MSQIENQQSCSERNQIVYKKDLPLSCPMDGTSLWNAHPKVYLPIEKTGAESCPYCGTHFVLQDD